MPVLTGTQYAQPSDLAALGILPAALQNVSAPTQTAALSAASGLADSYLQARYVLPITQWGQDLVRIVCIIAAYDLLTSRGYGTMQGADQNIRQRYVDALEWLQGVADEKKTPAAIVDSSIGSSGQQPPTPGDGSIVSSTEGGFQAQTSNVRGWTRRGQSSTFRPSQEFWDDKGS